MTADNGFDPADVAMEDGDAPPEPGLDPDLEAALAELLTAAETTAEDCTPPAANGGEPEEKAIRRGQKNTGHYSETGLFESGDCALCWFLCSLETGGCIAGVSGGCILSFVAYAACEAIGVAACLLDHVGCMDDCYSDGGDCCPVACGESTTCCLADETCLNREFGLCCGPDERPCRADGYGDFCCEGTEVCINDVKRGGVECCEPQNICGERGVTTCCNPTETCIPEFLVCCPAGQPPCYNQCCGVGQQCVNTIVCCNVANICNDRCCTDDQVCHAGVCCDPINVCGNVCCDELSSGCIPSLSLCCPFDRDVCGSTCCAIGESCLNGACCPDARICGDLCCPEGNGCDPQTNQCTPCPNPNDTPCLVGGCCPPDKVCSDEPGVCCDPGEIYCCSGQGGCGCKLPTYCLE